MENFMKIMFSKNKNYNNKSKVTKQMIRQAIKLTRERMDKHTNHMQAK